MLKFRWRLKYNAHHHRTEVELTLHWRSPPALPIRPASASWPAWGTVTDTGITLGQYSVKLRWCSPPMKGNHRMKEGRRGGLNAAMCTVVFPSPSWGAVRSVLHVLH